MEKDNLQGNEVIEEKINKLYENMSDRVFADLLESLRDRMKQGGHLVVAVKPSENNQLELRPVSTEDGNSWIAAFTSFEEEIKKKDAIVSGFTAEISKLFEVAMASDGLNGIVINPWDKAVKINKSVIKIIQGK